MSRLFITIALLLLAPLAWAEECSTPQNFAALVELIVNEGQPSDYGLSLVNEKKPDKYFASLVRGDFPELYVTRERWTRRGRKDHIDQWIMKFTVDSSSVLHKELWEQDHRVVREKRLSNKGADAVGCRIFGAFLGTAKPL